MIEWAPFRLKPGIDEAKLIEASERLQAEFLDGQDGFIRRELLRRSDGEYVDVVWWQSLDAAHKAMEKVADSATCSDYFAIMRTNDASAADGVEHLHAVRAYLSAA